MSTIASRSVPTSIALPTFAPADLQGVVEYLTQQNIALQTWIAQASAVINAVASVNTGPYTITVSGAGNLIATGNLGTQTVIGTP